MNELKQIIEAMKLLNLNTYSVPYYKEWNAYLIENNLKGEGTNSTLRIVIR
jgi:hypothetical protein